MRCLATGYAKQDKFGHNCPVLETDENTLAILQTEINGKEITITFCTVCWYVWVQEYQGGTIGKA